MTSSSSFQGDSPIVTVFETLKRALEAHLKRRFGEIFSIDYALLLYDVTSSYFEGEAASNPQAKREDSRGQRPDRKQVCIGLVVTRDGYPLGYDVFDGNRVDVTTVEEMVGTIEERYGKAGWVWVMDVGMVSEDILSPSGRDGRAIRAADAGVGSAAPELAGAGKSRLS